MNKEEKARNKTRSEPRDTIKLYVEVASKDVHFLDAIIKGYPGIANVRRQYALREDKTYFLILVSPDFLAETKKVLKRLKGYIHIGETYIEN